MTDVTEFASVIYADVDLAQVFMQTRKQGGGAKNIFSLKKSNLYFFVILARSGAGLSISATL